MGGLTLPVKIEGSVEGIKEKLNLMLAVTSYRNRNGWHLWQYDEDWNYTIEKDDNVCPVCEEFGRAFHIQGMDVPMLFPDRSRVEPTLFSPEVHLSQDLYPGLLGECRCFMEWVDYLPVLTERLERELSEVINF